jgi:hypothetical protein
VISSPSATPVPIVLCSIVIVVSVASLVALALPVTFTGLLSTPVNLAPAISTLPAESLTATRKSETSPTIV